MESQDENSTISSPSPRLKLNVNTPPDTTPPAATSNSKENFEKPKNPEIPPRVVQGFEYSTVATAKCDICQKKTRVSSSLSCKLCNWRCCAKCEAERGNLQHTCFFKRPEGESYQRKQPAAPPKTPRKKAGKKAEKRRAAISRTASPGVPIEGNSAKIGKDSSSNKRGAFAFGEEDRRPHKFRALAPSEGDNKGIGLLFHPNNLDLLDGLQYIQFVSKEVIYRVRIEAGYVVLLDKSSIHQNSILIHRATSHYAPAELLFSFVYRGSKVILNDEDIPEPNQFRLLQSTSIFEAKSHSPNFRFHVKTGEIDLFEEQELQNDQTNLVLIGGIVTNQGLPPKNAPLFRVLVDAVSPIDSSPTTPRPHSTGTSKQIGSGSKGAEKAIAK